MKPETWDQLMRNARYDAQRSGQRTRVVGVRLSDRAAQFIGKRWVYAVTFAEKQL